MALSARPTVKTYSYTFSMTGVEVVPFGQHAPNFQTVIPYDHVETWEISPFSLKMHREIPTLQQFRWENTINSSVYSQLTVVVNHNHAV